MFETIKTFLSNWNATKGERQKLQHTYLVLSLIIVLTAGLMSLVNPQLGQAVVRFALVAITVYFVNAVVWNLLESSFLAKLPKPASKK